jgi:hypothetical protein
MSSDPRPATLINRGKHVNKTGAMQTPHKLERKLLNFPTVLAFGNYAGRLQ